MPGTFRVSVADPSMVPVVRLYFTPRRLLDHPLWVPFFKVHAEEVKGVRRRGIQVGFTFYEAYVALTVRSTESERTEVTQVLCT